MLYVVQFQDVFIVVISKKFSSKLNPTAKLWFANFQSDRVEYLPWNDCIVTVVAYGVCPAL